MTILSVVGARPNFMKVAPLHRALEARGATSRIVHTGQHYDEQMSDVFFAQLGLPEPDVYLGVGSGSHAKQTAAVMTAFEPVLHDEDPDWVVVVGDVNSTLACTLVVVKEHVRVAHVEAGLRSGDRRMPEEINRLVTDRIADLLFVTEQSGVDHLRAEGIDDDRIVFAGNVMIDTLVACREAARTSGIVDDFAIPRRNVAITRYASPIKLLEAMASGCACVASPVGDIRHVLADGRGLLVDAASPDGWRTALTELAEAPSVRRAFARRARTWAEKRETWDDAAARHASLYAHL